MEIKDYCKKRITPLLLAALGAAILAIFACAPAYSDVHYVVPTGGSTTWTGAVNSVQTAINAATAGDEVWVAAGTYNECITLKSAVKLYGGFHGNETLCSQRRPAVYETILDGTGENSSVVTIVAYASSATEISGFTIRNGAGTLVSPAMRKGGGIYTMAYSSPKISNNRIVCNLNVNGGQLSDPSDGYRGAGIYCDAGSPVIANNLIAGNGSFGAIQADTFGGGICCASGTAAIVNNTIVRNAAYGAVAVYSETGSAAAVISNNIIAYNFGGSGTPTWGINRWSTSTATNNRYYPSTNASNYAPGSTLGDPCFVSFTDNPGLSVTGMSFSLGPGSACVDAGDDTKVQPDWTDIDGETRTYDYISGGAIVDVGADERCDGDPPTNTTVTDGGDYTADNTKLEGSWSAVDTVTGVAEYQYKVGTSPHGFDIRNWTSVGTQTNGPITGLNLSDGVTYYISVKARDNAGNWSTEVSTDGITVDATPPSRPVVTDDGQYTTSPSLHASWTCSDEHGTPIIAYEYAIGKNPLGLGIGWQVPWTPVSTANVTRSVGTLQGGWPYYFYVRAKNAAGMWSEVGISDGIGVEPIEQSLDLLLGIGEFAKSTYTVWKYGGEEQTFQHGDEPTDHDKEVADAWWGDISMAMPASDGIFGCSVDGGEPAQYIGIRNGVASGGTDVTISTDVPVVGGNPYVLNPDDSIRFVAKVKLVADVQGVEIIPSMGVFGAGSKTLALSTQNYTDVEYPCSVSTTGNYINPYIRLWTCGSYPGSYVGLLIKDAHLYVTRNGQVLTEHVPAERTRNIATQGFYWAHQRQGERPSAANVDELCSELYTCYKYISTLRKLNPDIKIPYYQTGMAVKSAELPPYFAQAPFILNGDFIDQHADWLWLQSNPKAQNDPDPGDGYAHDYLNIGNYPDVFAINCVESPDYQTAWLSRVLSRLSNVGADSIWMDDCGVLDQYPDQLADPLMPRRDGAVREGWKVQKFLHAVIPGLRAAGITTIVNGGLRHLDGGNCWTGDVGAIYFDPNWDPIAPYTTNYEGNTPQNTPDVFISEYAFIYNDCHYSRDHWLRSLNDADIVYNWNSSLEPSYFKRIHYTVAQAATSANPVSGWLQFGFASYLLCQNQYTSFGAANETTTYFPYLWLGLTSKLGIPEGNDECVSGALISSTDPTPGQYLRYRYYRQPCGAANDGIVVANGDSVTHWFTLPFSAKRIDATKPEYAPDPGDDAYMEYEEAVPNTDPTIWPQGTTIQLEPNTACIFLRND